MLMVQKICSYQEHLPPAYEVRGKVMTLFVHPQGARGGTVLTGPWSQGHISATGWSRGGSPVSGPRSPPGCRREHPCSGPRSLLGERGVGKGELRGDTPVRTRTGVPPWPGHNKPLFYCKLNHVNTGA